MSIWIFDNEYTQCFSEARKEFLDKLLPSLSRDYNLTTALDVGCGLGFFSSYLASLEFKVTAVDARANNVAEAKQRFPDLEFFTQDVEAQQFQELGCFDLLLCLGLLYHLENPMRAIRNLYAVTEKILLVESRVAPHQQPVAAFVDEFELEDQSLQYRALIPSESCLIKMLYHAGFAQVYKTVELPDHEEFREMVSSKRRRTILVASKIKLISSSLRAVEQPQHSVSNLWHKGWGSQLKLLKLFRRMDLRKKPHSST